MLNIYAFITSWVSSRIDRTDRGATAVEYGLMVGLIALSIILTVTALGSRLDDLFTAVKDGIPIVAN